MRNLFFCFVSLLAFNVQSQCPWSFTITNITGPYTITCTNPTLNLSASHNNTNTVNYFWSGPAFTSTLSNVILSQAGNYSLVATDAITSCSIMQTFAILSNTAAPISSVGPTLAIINCISNALTFTAIAVNPTVNIQHDWYSPFSPFPGGTPIQTSTNTTDYLAGAITPGDYTLVTTNLANGCIALKTFTYGSITAFPTFSVTGNPNYSVGCTPTILSFTNAVSTQTLPAPLSYTFLPPSFVGTVATGVPLSPTSSMVVSTPGTWTMIAQDNVNFCRTEIMVPILQNGVLPTFNHTVAPGGVVNFQSTYTGTIIGTTFSWDFGDGTVGSGLSTSHTYTNGGIHNVVMSTNNPNCATGNVPVNVNTIPCLANSNFTLTYSGTPQTWFATPNYYGNVINAIWSWGDGNSDNALFPSHTYSAAGLYNICLTVTVSCVNSSSTCSGYNIYKTTGTYDSDLAMVTVSVVAGAPVGLKHLEEDNILFSLYPNPVNDVLTIELNNNEEIDVEIFNCIGVLVKKASFSTKKETFNLKELSNGVYVLKIKAGNFQYRNKKFIIAR